MCREWRADGTPKSAAVEIVGAGFQADVDPGESKIGPVALEVSITFEGRSDLAGRPGEIPYVGAHWGFLSIRSAVGSSVQLLPLLRGVDMRRSSDSSL